MEIQIRPATIFDIDAIYAIEKECFEKAFRFERNLFYLFLLGRDGEIFLVAEEIAQNKKRKAIVGFIVARLTALDSFEIITINVAPSKQNQGIGTRLMLEFERILKSKVKNIRELRTISLELVVYENNQNAKHLYEKLGYKEIKRLPNYYPKNRTGIKMMKKITWNDE